jgi:hypothetical protein
VFGTFNTEKILLVEETGFGGMLRLPAATAARCAGGSGGVGGGRQCSAWGTEEEEDVDSMGIMTG